MKSSVSLMRCCMCSVDEMKCNFEISWKFPSYRPMHAGGNFQRVRIVRVFSFCDVLELGEMQTKISRIANNFRLLCIHVFNVKVPIVQDLSS